MIFVFMIFSTNVMAEKETVTFSDCVDGDTIKVERNGKQVTVRFLAIDTPETVHPTKGVEPYGKEASDYTCDKVKNAKTLELELDPGSDEFDKYERLLAWIYVDGNLLQSELVSLGYARVAYLYGDYLYTTDLQELESEAGNNKLGIWSEEEYVSSTTTSKNDEEKTLLEKIKDLVFDTLKEYFNDLIKDMKKSIKKGINELFD